MGTRNLGNIVVTGATGFIGSHLVAKLLERGHSLTATARPNSRLDQGNLAHVGPHPKLRLRHVDILDPADAHAALEGCNTLFHLAAQVDVAHSLKSPTLFMQTNIMGTAHLLEAAKAQGVERIIVVSSSEVYGGTNASALTETSPLIAKSPYAATKIAAEKLAESFYHSYRLGTVVVRPFNTFGPRQSVRAVIPWIITQAIATGKLHLGNLKPARDFVFVEDTAEGMIAAASTPGIEGRVFNLATGRAHSIQEVITYVGEIHGKPLQVTTDADRVRGTEEVWTLLGDASVAQRELNWRPQVPFSEGLKRFYQYLKQKASEQAAS